MTHWQHWVVPGCCFRCSWWVAVVAVVREGQRGALFLLPLMPLLLLLLLLLLALPPPPFGARTAVKPVLER